MLSIRAFGRRDIEEDSIDFLLNPLFVFRNDLYVNLLHYMCYTKNEIKV